jgi:ABC-type dipeptide/oligopeptide/nickel transport system ATPase component/ABC-type dipeptide/oligopeptide/nickel transport system permease subunit
MVNVEVTEPTPLPTADARPGVLRHIASSPLGFVVLAWLGLCMLVGIFGRWLAPHDPDQTNPRSSRLGPFQSEFWLGTDSAGRDVLSRLLVSTQNSLLAAGITVVIALALGVTAGLIAGYFAGPFERGASWVVNLIMAMPGIVVLLAARTVLGTSIMLAMAIFGVLIAPAFYRLVHTTARAVAAEPYIDAAKVSGIPDRRIIARHILRVVRGPIIIQTSIVTAVAIAVLSGLALIGFGDQDAPTWGTMLSSGFAAIYRQRWLLLWPSAAIALTSLALALLGNLLRDALQGTSKAPGTKRRRKGKDAKRGFDAHVAEDPEPTAIDAGDVDDHGVHVDGDAPPLIDHGYDSTADSLLSVSGLVIGYPAAGSDAWVEVVSGFDLDIAHGEVHGLVGESGSGKTQSAFAIMGLLDTGGEILGGSVVFDGHQLTGDHAARARLRGRRIAYIPQEPMSNLDPSFRVGSQLVESMRSCLDIDKRAARERALELLDRVGIADPERTFNSYPHQLSGGMAQRVLIAGAVAAEPDLLIADEPTTALDVTVQAEVLDLLRELQRDTGLALLLVTHNMGVVADLAERVSVMQHGRVVETGSVHDVFREARHPYTRSLLAAIVDDHPPRPPYLPQAVTS